MLAGDGNVAGRAAAAGDITSALKLMMVLLSVVNVQHAQDLEEVNEVVGDCPEQDEGQERRRVEGLPKIQVAPWLEESGGAHLSFEKQRWDCQQLEDNEKCKTNPASDAEDTCHETSCKRCKDAHISHDSNV